MRAVVFPGQGAQRRGVGSEHFARYPELVATADELLGYSVQRLCIEDPERQLNRTLYTQPAMFVVNAMHWLDARARGCSPAMFAGHSLGEYNALWAAGAFDFETGLRLVQRRAELMDRAADGGMAAVLGIPAEAVARVLQASDAQAVDIANLNGPTQIVISGPQAEIMRLKPIFEAQPIRAYAILNVSAAFHSRAMLPAQREFTSFLAGFELGPLTTPVIANFSARPYGADNIAELLGQQIAGPVRWVESVAHMIEQGVSEFIECGPGDVLTKMIRQIRAERPELAAASQAPVPDVRPTPAPPEPAPML
ncbi:ACP S-malonyltransferase, partial [Enhygromyxa salina]|uniref:ACP S-malonyltransferase n=1 Tax=Enhygromyxa salina TaxID=215803 RepID=UPI001969DAF9